jgi:hypothetical protein
MTNSQFLRIKSLNTKTMRGVASSKSVIKVAAMHNLREIQAELGASAKSGINPARMAMNYLLRGCDTAAAVAGMAQALLDNAGANELRKDAIMALEVIFSVPSDSLVDQREFFAAAVAWTDAFFNVPILSAVVHLDEGAPHCHVLLLPLVAGRMRGGTLAGGPSKIKMMHADFQREVGQRFGLMHQPRVKGISKADRNVAGRQVLDLIKSHPECLAQPAVRDALIEALGQHHDTLLPVLGLELLVPAKAKHKSFVEIMTAPCKLDGPIGARTSTDFGQQKCIDVGPSSQLDEQSIFHNVYLCVDVQSSETDSFPGSLYDQTASGMSTTNTPVPPTPPRPSVQAGQVDNKVCASRAPVTPAASVTETGTSDLLANPDQISSPNTSKRKAPEHDKTKVKHTRASGPLKGALTQTQLVAIPRCDLVRLLPVAVINENDQSDVSPASSNIERTKDPPSMQYFRFMPANGRTRSPVCTFSKTKLNCIAIVVGKRNAIRPIEGLNGTDFRSSIRLLR